MSLKGVDRARIERMSISLYVVFILNIRDDINVS